MIHVHVQMDMKLIEKSKRNIICFLPSRSTRITGIRYLEIPFPVTSRSIYPSCTLQSTC